MNMKKNILTHTVAIIVGVSLILFLHTFILGGDELERELEIKARIEKAVKENSNRLRGDIPDTITDEQLQWYINGYKTGNKDFTNSVVQAVRSAKENGTLEEYLITVSVDGKVINFRVE